MAWFVHLEKFSLKFSIFPFVIHANLLLPRPSSFLYDLLVSGMCFSIVVNYDFQVSFNLKVIFYVAKITQNTVTGLL